MEPTSKPWLKWIGALIIVVAIGLIAANWQNKPVEPEITSTEETTSVTDTTTETTTDVISYNGVESKNAYELLVANHDVEAEEYSFGVIVNKIDGITPPEGKFWGFYINGQMADKGATEYVTQSSDLLEWKLTDIVQ